MKKNIGKLDRIIRSIIALVTVYLSFNTTAPTSILLIVIAIILILTSFIGTCPLYMPFGLNTCSDKK